MRSLQNTPSVRHLAVLVLMLAAAVVARPTPADAAKLHCRSLSFSGQAGQCMPPDIVQIRMVDVQGNEVHRSCNLSVQQFETALHFGSRLPRDLGSFGDCTPDFTDPQPVKKCWNGSGGSCKYKWKAKKQLLEVCCWQTPNCAGLKVGNYCNGGTNPLAKCTSNADCLGGGFCDMRTGTQGVSAQKQIQGVDPQFGPTPVPVAMVATLVQLDPIGMTQLPFPALGSCRKGIATNVQKLALITAQRLVECHRQQMLGSPIADCNTINTESDPTGAIEAAESAVATAAGACAPGGSPRSLGYGTCPPPCAMQINTCAAPTGHAGAPCNTDLDCDSNVGAGDGRCGSPADWAAAASCMTCQTEDAVVTAIEDKYGLVGSGLPPETVKCQDQIGRTFADLLKTQLAVTAKCQKLLDGGKTVLAFCQNGPGVGPPSHVGQTCMTDANCTPPDTQLCKYADQSRQRSFAEAKAMLTIDKACQMTDFSELDTCGIDLADTETCVVDNGREAGAAIADAIYPEGFGHNAP